MTDANLEDPKGEKKEEEPEKPRSVDAVPGQSSAQGTADEVAGWSVSDIDKWEEELEKPRSSVTETGSRQALSRGDTFTGWAGFKSEKREGEPEKPGSSVTEAGQGRALNTADKVTGWAGFKSEKKEGEPEKPRSSITEAGQSNAKSTTAEVSGKPVPKGEKKEEEPGKLRSSVTEPVQSSPLGTAETASLPGLKGEKTEGKPEKSSSFVMEPGLASAQDTAEGAGKPVPKGEKKEEEPGKPRSSIMEVGQSNAQGTPETARVPGPKGEKPEGDPEQPRDSIIEPGPECTQSAALKAGGEESSAENGEEQPEPLGYSILEPPPEPPKDFAKFDLRLPASANAAATANNPNGQAAAPLPPAQQAPIEPVQKSAPNPIRVYILAGVGMGLLFGCIIAFFSWRMSSPEGQYDLGPVTSSGAGLRGHLYTRWDKKLEYRLSFGPSAPEQQAGFALAVAHSPRPLSIDIHLQDAQGFVLCSREVVLKYDGSAAPGAPGAPNPDAAGGKADAANLPGNEPAHGMQDLLAAQEAERELGKEVFKNEIGPDGLITGINAQGEIPCAEKVYANASSWSFTTNFPSLAEQDELGKHQEVAQASEEHPSAKAGSHKKAAAIPPPVLLPFSIEGDDAIVDFDLSSGVIETRDNKTFFVGKAIGISLDSRWLEFPVSIHYKCDQTSMCVLTHAGAGALRARLKR